MRRNISCRLFLLSGFLFFQFGHILARNISFTSYKVEQGLSQNSVWCMLQDKEGFLWLGTKDGLNRFDGQNFKIYRSSSKNVNSIGNNFIRSLLEPNENELWVGTDQGLYIYHKQTETFSLFDKKTSDGISIDKGVNTMMIDNNGNYWIGSFFQGIFCYNPATGDLKLYDHHPENDSSLGSNLVWTAYLDKKGEIWIGTYEGGLNLYDSQKDVFIRYLPGNSGLNDNSVISIFEDSKSRFWIGT